MNRSDRRTGLAALGTVLLLIAGVAESAAASGTERSGTRHAVASGAGDREKREAAALTGTAKLYRSAGDDITFTFDAHLAAKDDADPTKATGTFEFSHYVNGVGARAKAEVDCLLTGGRVAVVSGVITDSDLPGAEGRRVGITVHDLGSHDRLGYSWASVGSPAETGALPACVGSAPFEKVRRGTGDYRVVPWRPKL
ncbi:Repetin [Streptomyces sp. NPDC005551]|uniref:Repetin n=1 Tax=Streptomyces sp. NPDC005551 TaxID=3364725 RepID=UPI0036B7C37A